jgi:hypothetical protein
MGKGAGRGQQKPNITERNATKPDWTLRRNGDFKTGALNHSATQLSFLDDLHRERTPRWDTATGTCPSLKFNNLMVLRHHLGHLGQLVGTPARSPRYPARCEPLARSEILCELRRSGVDTFRDTGSATGCRGHRGLRLVVGANRSVRRRISPKCLRPAAALKRDRIVGQALPTAAANCRESFSSDPSGSRGILPFSGTLHHGQGAPAAPQVQACSPAHGRAGWFSHTSRNPRRECGFLDGTIHLARSWFFGIRRSHLRKPSHRPVHILPNARREVSSGLRCHALRPFCTNICSGRLEHPENAQRRQAE